MEDKEVDKIQCEEWDSPFPQPLTRNGEQYGILMPRTNWTGEELLDYFKTNVWKTRKCT